MKFRPILLTLLTFTALALPTVAAAQTRPVWLYCELNWAGEQMHISPVIEVVVLENEQWKQSARAAIEPSWRLRLTAIGLDLAKIERSYETIDEVARPRCYAHATEAEAVSWFEARKNLMPRDTTVVEWNP